MKKFLYFICSAVLIMLTIYLIIPLISLNNLPPVEYLTLENKKKDISKIDLANKKTLLFYVNPKCDACNEIVEIIDKTDRNLFNVIILSSFYNEISYMDYKSKFNLLNNDIFLIDQGNSFIHDFNIGLSYSMPIILQYDEKGHIMNRKKIKSSANNRFRSL